MQYNCNKHNLVLGTVGFVEGSNFATIIFLHRLLISHYSNLLGLCHLLQNEKYLLEQKHHSPYQFGLVHCNSQWESHHHTYLGFESAHLVANLYRGDYLDGYAITCKRSIKNFDLFLITAL